MHMAGKDPDKDEIPVTVRFPADIQRRAKRLADKEERSFNLWIVRAVRDRVEQDERAETLAVAEPVPKKRGGRT